jgi:hypothetical protein
MNKAQIYLSWADEILQIAAVLLAKNSSNSPEGALADATELVAAHAQNLKDIRDSSDSELYSKS